MSVGRRAPPLLSMCFNSPPHLTHSRSRKSLRGWLALQGCAHGVDTHTRRGHTRGHTHTHVVGTHTTRPRHTHDAVQGSAHVVDTHTTRCQDTHDAVPGWTAVKATLDRFLQTVHSSYHFLIAQAQTPNTSGGAALLPFQVSGFANRCRPNSAYIGESRPNYGFCLRHFQASVFGTFPVDPFSLGGGFDLGSCGCGRLIVVCITQL